MKTLLRVVGAIVVCVVVVLGIVSMTGLDPDQRRPGLWLKGETPPFPSDWSFADKYQTILVETHPWYLLPHSVTMYFVTYQGHLYLHADYPRGEKFPGGKTWITTIASNPNVRVKLGDQVFDGTVVMVKDQAEWEGCFESFKTKYPKSSYSKDDRRPEQDWLRLMPE